MFKRILLWMQIISVVAVAQGQAAREEAVKPQRSAAPQSEAGFIVPSEVNVRIEPDVRTFVVMAAINIAGFDFEPGGQPLSPARAELRRDLANLDPKLKESLSAYYKANRRQGVDEAVDAGRYAALSLMMTQPPSFSVYVRDEETVPLDIKPLLSFVPLVQQFYLKSNIKELVPKYINVGNAYATAYRRPVGELIYRTLEYFHTTPQTIINMRPLVVESTEQGARRKNDKPSVVARTRTRHVFIVPDPLSPLGTSFVRDDFLNQKEDILSRRIGDDYMVIVGPSRNYNVEAIRRALIRFIIDPMVERHLRASLEYKEQILNLVASVPTAAKPFGTSGYLVLRESLAQAAEARMRRLLAMEGGPAYTEDQAINDVAQAYLRGAVLAFHFYESLQGLEKVGINIEDFFDQMVATTKFDKEAGRSKEFEPVVARVAAANRANATRNAAVEMAGDPVTARLTSKILESDDLIRQRRFNEAEAVLDEILEINPKNARALYGLAQVKSQTPSPVENDPNADENDKIQAQHDRLEEALKLYRKAIENASPDSERWLIQWSHVLIGRILDFQEFRADAVAAYEKAEALGDVPNGAYKEALEGKRRPHGLK